MKQLHPLLNQFDIEELRPAQRPLIEAALSGRDVFAVLPTGAGKSLCFQLPACAHQKLTLVVSPLLALMRDQIAALRARGIGALMLSSEQSEQERGEIYAQLAAGKIKLLYLSPEQLGKISTNYLLSKIELARIVIDEVHCFSQWGHSFRPEYREIPKFLNTYPKLPVSAFTATATQAVRADIAQNLFADRDVVTAFAPVDRPNIALKFLHKNKPRAQLLAAIKPNQPTIIYAGTRAKTEVLAKAIREFGYQAEHYHAGRDAASRRQIEAEFKANKISAIIATSAFGMGVDKGDIRAVIHADPPASIESFVQEIGRAGRNDLAASAVCLWNAADFAYLQDRIMRNTAQDDLRNLEMARLGAMQELCENNGGWPEIARYFAQDLRATKPDLHENSTRLWAWRAELARKKHCAPFIIIPDDVLTRINAKRPRNIDELAAISGMGATRMRNYADAILQILNGDFISHSKARQMLALQGEGARFDRIHEEAIKLRLGVDGCARPLTLPKPLIRRILTSKPKNFDALARIQGMDEARLARFGQMILLEIGKNGD